VKQVIGILGWLGVALVVAAVVLRFARPQPPELYQNFAYAGLAVTVVYALTQWREIRRSFGGRNVQYGSVAAGSIVIFLALLVGVNWVANRQNKRWDLTESKQFSLSDQTNDHLVAEGASTHQGVLRVDQRASRRQTIAISSGYQYCRARSRSTT
jgi:ABC-type uncharacterized transport system involved in gliding motility auxiliary subunit